jgi:chromosome segregation ATPase
LRAVAEELATKTRYILGTERTGEEQKTRLEQLEAERAKLEQERSVGDGRVSRLLAQANDTQKKMAELEAECCTLRERSGRLEQANE